MPGTYAIAVAAGRGTRFGGETPKQYRMLAGRPVLRHAVEALLRGSGLAGLAVAIHPEDRALYDSAVGDLPLLPPVQGGAHRQDSVLAALEALAPLDPDAVLIHDGARSPPLPRRTVRSQPCRSPTPSSAQGAPARSPPPSTARPCGGRRRRKGSASHPSWPRTATMPARG